MKAIVFSGMLCVLAACSISVRGDESAFRFVALGDAPYGLPDAVDAPYQSLLAKISADAPPLVIHVGDLHGVRTCSDARLDQLRGYLDAVAAPVLYTPGDNEWTDCHRAEVGDFDPLERLSYIRATYFRDDRTLGRTRLAAQTQRSEGYPENRWLMVDNVGFITVHVVGSHNNFSRDDLDATREFMARNAANVRWLEQSFAALSDAEAIVVALHADMFFETDGFRNGWLDHSPFYDMGVTLGQQSSAFEKPVLLLYGDSHQFKSFQPFPKHRPFLHAMEVYGFPDIKAIEIAVDPNARRPFRVSRVISP